MELMKALWKCRDRTSNPTGIGDVTKTSRMRDTWVASLRRIRTKGRRVFLPVVVRSLSCAQLFVRKKASSLVEAGTSGFL